jgi:hypothetical protein
MTPKSKLLAGGRTLSPEELRKRSSRRAFLRSLGAGAVALPFLHYLGEGSSIFGGRARADLPAIPQRLLIVFSADGTIAEEWVPDGTEDAPEYRRILAPLEAHKAKTLVLSGVDMSSTDAGPGDGHQKGMGHVLTGVELLPGDVMGGCDACPPVSWSSDISVDQAVANHISDEITLRLRSLELGALVSDAENVWTRMSYRGASQPIPPINDPFDAFTAVFGDPTLDPEQARRRLMMQESVLDQNVRDFQRLAPRLSTPDREMLERHLTMIRDIETRLTAPGAVGAYCARPELGSPVNPREDANLSHIIDLQSEIMTMAFACDVTRVGSIMWENSVGNVDFSFHGINAKHHDLSHEGDSNATAIEQIVQINIFYAEKFAQLLDRLDSIPEGDGETMLDHTLVVWVNELGRGNSHSLTDIPFVLAGNVLNADGTRHFRMGRHVHYDGDQPHNDLLTSICQAFGMSTAHFGDMRFSNGPLARLV